MHIITTYTKRSSRTTDMSLILCDCDFLTRSIAWKQQTTHRNSSIKLCHQFTNQFQNCPTISCIWWKRILPGSVSLVWIEKWLIDWLISITTSRKIGIRFYTELFELVIVTLHIFVWCFFEWKKNQRRKLRGWNQRWKREVEEE